MEHRFNWNEMYSVHVTAIDRQHQQLFDTMNELNEALQKSRGDTVVEDVLKRLENYTRSHFAAEEKLLETYGYPDLAAHKERHKALMQKIEGFMTSHKAGNVGVPASLMLFLSSWLKEHILGVDKNYSSYLGGKGVH